MSCRMTIGYRTPSDRRPVLFGTVSHWTPRRWVRSLCRVLPVKPLSPASGAPPPTQTAVIVPVPAADSLVDEHRRHLDVAASWGVPAHVSVLYPFVEPAQVDDQLIATLATVFGSVPAF